MSEIKINFHLTDAESKLMDQIVTRAAKIFTGEDRLDIEMDITACHCNGSPLDLKKMLEADDFNFAHDIAGIACHIDRSTGKLDKGFLPRCSLPRGKL